MKQPRALYLLNFISMWECFSYYGMRALLVLFLVQQLKFDDTQAFGLYALYVTLVELGGVIGGRIADSLLGLKRSIVLGGWTIALGHICLVGAERPLFFYLGLSLIIAGTSLFRSNVAALLGEFYEENDPRLEAGYTLYYTGINLGGFLAAIFCGIVGQAYGWGAGFGLAALGMLAANVVLFLGDGILQDKGRQENVIRRPLLKGVFGLATSALVIAALLYFQSSVSIFLPFLLIACVAYAYRKLQGVLTIRKKELRFLGALIGLLVIFFCCEEQLGSVLVLFIDRHVDTATQWGQVPAATMIVFNPLTILVAGPLLSRLLQNRFFAPIGKIGISFCFLGLAFFGLYFGASHETVPLTIVIGSFVLIGLGELLIGPTVYAAASKIAPKGFEGLVMGMVTLGYSMANLISGWVSQMMAVSDTNISLETYSSGFLILSEGAFAVAFFLIVAHYVGRQRQVFA